MKYAIFLLAVVTTLAGCKNSNDRIAFDGKYFRTKVTKVDGKLDVFQVTVKDAAQSVEGARAAGLHEANSYCVRNFGSSEIDWVVGPDAPADQLRIVNGDLVLQGVCPQ